VRPWPSTRAYAGGRGRTSTAIDALVGPVVKVSRQQPALGGLMIVGNIDGDNATRKLWLNERGVGNESARPVTTRVLPIFAPGSGNHGIFCDSPLRVLIGPTRRLKRPLTLSYSVRYPTSGPTFTARPPLRCCTGAAMQTAEVRSNASAPTAEVYDRSSDEARPATAHT
jgi:hypothetical protein